MKDDTEYEEAMIARVVPDENGYTLHRTDGWAMHCPPIPDGYLPEAGDMARFYGPGIGRPVRGLVINGHVAFYLTPEEQEAQHQADLRSHEQKLRDDFERNRLELDAQFAALPAVFQKRLARYRANQPNFRWKYEAYEMSVCVDAVKMAQALKTPEAVVAYHKLGWEEQQAAVPGLFAGHSGNTFGCAVLLAHDYLRQPDRVWLGHAAIATFIGCDEAGCPPVPESEWPESMQ